MGQAHFAHTWLSVVFDEKAKSSDIKRPRNLSGIADTMALIATLALYRIAHYTQSLSNAHPDGL
jgi:hypothetical protein